MALTVSLADIAVILVEPSAMQASLICRMLEHQGAQRIMSLQTATEALAALQQCDATSTLVISSLYLSDMAGTELVEAMRHDEYLEAIPFILVSSETRPQKLESIRQSGACSIIEKPFTEQQLGRALFAAADYLNPPNDVDLAETENLRVLLVDDSALSRRHISRLLEQIGITQIIEAENGKEAVQWLQETSVDLVITDYNMPEMDGRDLTEYIRTQSWQSTVPVLMITSEQNQGRLAAVECAGVSAICDKPFEASSIRKLINDALLH